MIEVSGDRREALAQLAASHRLLRRVQAENFQLAAAICDLYSEVDHPEYLLPGVEKMVELASDGTPLVAEFATLEVAACLGVSEQSANDLMASALDVRHRLPSIWRLVDELVVPVWQAREVALLAHDLPHAACLELDRQLASSMVGMSWRRIRRMVLGLVLDVLPPEEAAARREQALEHRHVVVGDSRYGLSPISGVLDAGDAVLLDAQLDRLARILAEGGHDESLAARRAVALGVLANPARALHMVQASLLDELPTDPDDFEECFRAGQAGHACGAVTVDPDRLLPAAELVVHLTDVTLAEGMGTCRDDRVGPLLAEWAEDLLGHRRIVVRPVIDANHLAPSDAYECPERMRQSILWREQSEVFPWSSRGSGRCDLDHTVPYQRGGPPGQTRPDNLAPLGRKVHRAKTHGGYQLEQPIPGVHLWTTPLGRRYLVTGGHTIALDPPTRDYFRSTVPVAA